MLNLIQAEFMKLRRRKLIPIMLLAALFMPFFTLVYFNYFGKKGIDPMQFYKMSAFGYTMFIILPFILGILCTMLMHDENQNDMLKQLWIVPVSKIGYFFSKFFVVLIYSVCFMLITAAASVMFSVLSGYVVFELGSVLYLLERCLEIGVLTALAMLPILALATSRKGYILPVSITLVYAVAGFFLMGINMYLHPITSTATIIMRNGDIPGLELTQTVSIPLAVFSICIWDVAATLFARISLGRK